MKTMNKNKQDERRHDERFEAWTNLSLDDNGKWRSGFIRDISKTGAQIVTSQFLQPGDKTTLIFDNIKDQENVIVKGEVVWRTRTQKHVHWSTCRMGIKFDGALFVEPQACVPGL